MKKRVKKLYKKENFDDTMLESVENLEKEVVGHRIVSVDKNITGTLYTGNAWVSTFITLDNGKRVELIDSGDCCAYTELESFLLHPDKIDHIITGVGTTDRYTTWHIYADMGDVLELTVGWSEGSGYYGYGFDIRVKDI